GGGPGRATTRHPGHGAAICCGCRAEAAGCSHARNDRARERGGGRGGGGGAGTGGDGSDEDGERTQGHDGWDGVSRTGGGWPGGGERGCAGGVGVARLLPLTLPKASRTLRVCPKTALNGGRDPGCNPHR